MKSPLRIWLLYIACLAIAIPSLAWLSWQAIALDKARERDRQETELARREAELQERISSALWRLDSLLSPLIAQEAARPYYLYRSFLEPIPVSVQSGEQQVQEQLAERLAPSPLLISPSQLVLLNFQVTPENVFSSPQSPQGGENDQAIHVCGVSAEFLSCNGTRLQQLGSQVTYSDLLSRLPHPEPPAGISAFGGGDESVPDAPTSSRVGSSISNYLPEGQVEIPEEKKPSGNEEMETGNSRQMAQQSRNEDRGNREFNQRFKSLDNLAQTAWAQSMEAGGIYNDRPDSQVVAGIMRPFWVGERLLLARRVDSPGETLVQGCWLHWERIQAMLRNEVEDLLPEVAFVPVTNSDELLIGQTLATLPVQLKIDRDRIRGMLDLPVSPSAPASGIGRALGFAWACLGIVAVAGAFLLNGLIQLSQRRGAFVSAVTHELRTPLTTFRMYAEMLAERMVPSPEKQQQYAETMRVEADRLGHLVENVLQFARLEKTNLNTRLEPTSWSRLLDRFESRLSQRAAQGDMNLQLAIDADDMERTFRSDPAAIEQIVFNLVDNACKYARNSVERKIILSVEFANEWMTVSVRDFGPGIAAGEQRRMFRPFSKSDQSSAETAQGVGLGLALCRRMAANLRGSLNAENAEPGLRMILRLPLNETKAGQ
jgi:signal transduction histidine kinase